MKKLNLILAVALLATGASKAAADKVILAAGNKVEGNITAVSRTNVTAGGNRYSVSQIKGVEFGGEPAGLTQARDIILSAHPNFDQAYAAIARISIRALKPNVKADVEYYRALCQAKLGRAGLMARFVSGHAKSFHYYEANEVLAEAAIAALPTAKDKPRYVTLIEGCVGRLTGAAGLPAVAQKGTLLRGKLQLAQKNYAAAANSFNLVIKDDGPGAGFTATRNRMAARVGMARSWAASKKADAGVKLVEQVIAWAPPEDNELHAEAYNALGYCHKAAGRPKDAVLAFLHTEVLYFQNSNLRAEARKNLASLFTKLKDKKRAKEFGG